MSDIFELSSRLKVRFKSANGVVNSEDLWSFSKNDLNDMYITIEKIVESNKGSGLLKEKSAEIDLNELRLKIIEHIFNYKVAKSKEAELAKVKAERKSRILEIIANKQDNKLMDKSIKELTKELDSL